MLHLLVMAAADAASDVPWPISLGVSGTGIAGLVGILIWLNRQFATGNFITRSQRTKELETVERAHASEIAALTAMNAQAVASALTYGSEWKETAKEEQKGRVDAQAALYEAVKQNSIVTKFFAEVPLRPNTRDDGHLEVTS
jgi:hypothetical protein